MGCAYSQFEPKVTVIKGVTRRRMRLGRFLTEFHKGNLTLIHLERDAFVEVVIAWHTPNALSFHEKAAAREVFRWVEEDVLKRIRRSERFFDHRVDLSDSVFIHYPEIVAALTDPVTQRSKELVTKCCRLMNAPDPERVVCLQTSIAPKEIKSTELLKAVHKIIEESYIRGNEKDREITEPYLRQMIRSKELMPDPL